MRIFSNYIIFRIRQREENTLWKKEDYRRNGIDKFLRSSIPSHPPPRAEGWWLGEMETAKLVPSVDEDENKVMAWKRTEISATPKLERAVAFIVSAGAADQKFGPEE